MSKITLKLEDLIILLDSPEWNEIEPNLFLGSVKAIQDESLIKRINAVVSITRIPTETFGLPSRISVSQGNHLDICLPDNDEANISQHFDEVYTFIRQHVREGHSVLVHCAAGISRSTTLVAAYLMMSYQWDAFEALELIKERRPCIRPNDGFLEQLLVLSEKISSNPKGI